VDRITRVALALGSNLGDRHAHLNHAVGRLQTILRHFQVSRYRETVPIGMRGPQRMVLNAAATGDTTLSARALLDVLLGIDPQAPYITEPATLYPPVRQCIPHP